MKGLNIGKRIRRYILTGMAALFPLFVTIYIIVFVFRMGNRLAGKYINAFLMENYGFAVPGLGLIFILLLLIAIGFVSSHFIGRRILPFLEKIFMKIPLVANLYPSAKQLSDFLFRMDKEKEFKKVVLVPYPVYGSYSMGFVTNERLPVSDKEKEQEIVSVLVPLAPAPFSGVLLFMPKSKLRILEIPIDEAVKMIVSGGVVLPSKQSFYPKDLKQKEG